MRVDCPCCKGEKRLLVHELVDGVEVVSVPPCGHCQGEGEIEAEIADTPERVVPRY